jgi:hypothetical protein
MLSPFFHHEFHGPITLDGQANRIYFILLPEKVNIFDKQNRLFLIFSTNLLYFDVKSNSYRKASPNFFPSHPFKTGAANVLEFNFSLNHSKSEMKTWHLFSFNMIPAGEDLILLPPSFRILIIFGKQRNCMRTIPNFSIVLGNSGQWGRNRESLF